MISCVKNFFAFSWVLLVPFTSCHSGRQVGMIYLQDRIPDKELSKNILATKSAFSMMLCSLICLNKRGCIVSLFVVAEENCILLRSYLKTVERYRPTEDENDKAMMIVLSSDDPCKPDPCHRDANCIRQESGYECLCPYNRFGNFCDKEISGKSCLDIQEKHKSRKLINGYYSIIFQGKLLFKAYCDMINEGGGWTEVLKVDSHTENKTKMHISIYSTLQDANTKINFALLSPALLHLRNIANFTRFRFKCRAKITGRTLHFELQSQQEIDYLTGVSDFVTERCSNLKLLTNDNSMLGERCSDWKPLHSSSNRRLLDHPFYIEAKFHWLLVDNRYECDNGIHAKISIGDFWRVYVK